MKSKKTINEEYIALRDRTDKSDWESIGYLTGYASSIEESNPDLAAKIMRRVGNLKNIKKTAEENIDTTLEEVSKETVQLKWYKKPFFILIIMPVLLFSFYQLFWASPRFESQSKVIVKQPDAISTMDSSMALLTGLGVDSGNVDAKLVSAFIISNDMLQFVNQEIDLISHYKATTIDLFSRLPLSASNEDLLSFFRKHISAEIDEKSQIITISTQGFTPEYAKKLNQIVLSRAEWFINQISQNLAKEQVAFIEKEHALIESKLSEVKKTLLEFQRKHKLLDPESEGAAFQQIAYTIEAKIVEKEAELAMARDFLSESSPQVISLKNQLAALKKQLKDERDRLSSETDKISVSEALAVFSNYKVDLELALKAYASSLISLEKSRIESYKKIKFLVVIDQSTLPEDKSYPRVFYNISLLTLVLVMLFGIGAIIRTTYRELS